MDFFQWLFIVFMIWAQSMKSNQKKQEKVELCRPIWSKCRSLNSSSMNLGVGGQMWLCHSRGCVHVSNCPCSSDDLPKPKATELLQKGVESIQEYSASEEREEGRRWRVFRIGEQEHRVDMKAIEPYKRVISHGGQWSGAGICASSHTHTHSTDSALLHLHLVSSSRLGSISECVFICETSIGDTWFFLAGYYGDGLNAIIVFAVCFMPESNQPNYRYIMDNLFK